MIRAQQQQDGYEDASLFTKLKYHARISEVQICTWVIMGSLTVSTRIKRMGTTSILGCASFCLLGIGTKLSTSSWKSGMITHVLQPPRISLVSCADVVFERCIELKTGLEIYSWNMMRYTANVVDKVVHDFLNTCHAFPLSVSIFNCTRATLRNRSSHEESLQFHFVVGTSTLWTPICTSQGRHKCETETRFLVNFALS